MPHAPLAVFTSHEKGLHANSDYHDTTTPDSLYNTLVLDVLRTQILVGCVVLSCSSNLLVGSSLIAYHLSSLVANDLCPFIFFDNRTTFHRDFKQSVGNPLSLFHLNAIAFTPP